MRWMKALIISVLVVLCQLPSVTPWPAPVHATVNEVVSANRYIGDGTTTAFTYSFEIYDQTALEVVVDTVTKTINTDYTVSGVNNSGGGTVTFLTAPLSQAKITLLRKQPSSQLSNYVAHQAFPSTQVMQDLDRATMQIQQNREQLLRVPMFFKRSTFTNFLLDDPVAGMYAQVKSDNSGIQWVALTATGTYANPITTKGDLVCGGASGQTSRLGVGNDGFLLEADSTQVCGIAWNSRAAILFKALTTKGDILVSTGATTQRKAIGTDNNVLVADSSQSDGMAWKAASPQTQDFRCTLTSGIPITTSDVTAATSIYISPYRGTQMALFASNVWTTLTSAEITVSVPNTTTTMYDLFCRNNAGVIACDTTAWTNDTTRATALAKQDGIYIKSGDTTRRYICSFRTTAVSGQTEDSAANRLLWNYYHRKSAFLKVIDTTDTWNYTTATWRQARGSVANQVNLVMGVVEDSIDATVHGIASNSGGTPPIAVGIGINSTTVNSAQTYGAWVTTTGIGLEAHFAGFLAIGYNNIIWLEISNATGTTTWVGDNGSTVQQSGLVVTTMR